MVKGIGHAKEVSDSKATGSNQEEAMHANSVEQLPEIP